MAVPVSQRKHHRTRDREVSVELRPVQAVPGRDRHVAVITAE
jgi:hypothetical protein